MYLIKHEHVEPVGTLDVVIDNIDTPKHERRCRLLSRHGRSKKNTLNWNTHRHTLGWGLVPSLGHKNNAPVYQPSAKYFTKQNIFMNC